MISYDNGDVVGLRIGPGRTLSDFLVKIIGGADGQYCVPFLVDNPVPVPVEVMGFYAPTWMPDVTIDEYLHMEAVIKEMGLAQYFESWNVLLNEWLSTQQAVADCGL